MIEIWIVLLVSLFGMLFLGQWIGVALGLTGAIVMFVWGGGFSLLGSELWASLNIYGLTAIPGFVFVGEVIMRSGLAGKAFQAIAPLAQRLPGKLLQVNILLCAMFAAVFGSSTACAAAVGAIVIPELRQRGYNEELILGTVTVAGTMAFVIPPSSQFILYGSIVNAPIAALFLAGTIPGLLMAGLFMLYLAFKSRISPEIVPQEEKVPLGRALLSLLTLWPLFVIMVLCVAPIYLGVATPTEAAGLGAFAAILVGKFFGDLKFRSMWVCLRETTKVLCMLYFIIVGAMVMSAAVSQLGLPRQVIEWIGAMDVSPFVIMAAIYLLYVCLGCLFDGISMMFMTLPFVFPIVFLLGFDPVWFGVALCLLMEISIVTPPVGMNLYIVKAVAGPGTEVSTIFRGSVPFLICSVITLCIITFFPKIVLWLPELVLG